MTLKERLIDFQNRAEKKFNQKKNITTTVGLILAYCVFMGSTMLAGITIPVRIILRWLSGNTNSLIKVTASNHDQVIQKNKLVVLDFWADWCGPCILMNEAIKQFSESNTKVAVGKVNVDMNRSIAEKYKVRGIPQILLLQDGKEIKRNVGPMTLQELEEFIK